MPTKLKHKFIVDDDYLPFCKYCEMCVDYKEDLYDELHINYKDQLLLCKECSKKKGISENDIKYESNFVFGNIFDRKKAVNECSKCNGIFDKSIYVDDCVDELLCMKCSEIEKSDCKKLLIHLYDGYHEYINPLVECYNCGLNFIEKYQNIKNQNIEIVKCTEFYYPK